MLDEKSVNRLTALLVSGMILLTGILVWVSNHETISASLTKTTTPVYVEKIFNSDEVLEIDIQISEENWNSIIENATSEQYVMADIVINGEVFQSVGIRPKGNSSLSMVASDDSTDRFSFKVDFSEYVDGQTLYGLQKLALNNMIGDATYMKEYLSYDMFSAMGIATPGYSYANININGEPWGLYLALEVMEESFVQRYFGTISGSLYKPESDSLNMGNKEEKQGMMGQNPFNQQAQLPFTPKSEEESSADEPKAQNGMGAQDHGQMAEGMTPPDTGEMLEGMPTPGNGENPEEMPTPGNGENPEGMPTPGNGEIPEGMPTPGNGEMPEGMPTSDNGENPEGMPTPGNGENPEEMPTSDNGQMSEGMSVPDASGVAEEMTPPNETGMKQNNPMGGGMSASGSNLVYSDDELSSYSAIFENSVLKGTTEDAYHKVIEMMKNLNAGTNLEQYLDVEEILRYFAVNTFLVNLDSYAGSMKHNYYLYEQDGVFQILPWDLNLSFGAFNINDSHQVINFPIDEPVTDTMQNSPLISKLLEVDEYKALYHDYLQELIEVYIESGKYEATIQQLDLLIQDYVANDATAFYSYDEYCEAIPQLLVFGNDRTTSIKAQLAGEQPSETYGSVETDLDLDALGSQNGAGGQKGMMGEISSFENRGDEVKINQPFADPNGSSTKQDEVTNSSDLTPSKEENAKPMNPTPDGMTSMGEALKSVMGSLDMTQIQQLVAQLSGKTTETLTQEDLNLLKELGIDDTLIPTILELVENFSSFGMRGGSQINQTPNATNSEQLVVATCCFVVILSGLFFVSHYQKRKFRS